MENCQFCNLSLSFDSQNIHDWCKNCDTYFYNNAGYDICLDGISYIFIDSNDITIEYDNKIIKLDFDPEITPSNAREKITKILKLKNFL